MKQKVTKDADVVSKQVEKKKQRRIARREKKKLNKNLKSENGSTANLKTVDILNEFLKESDNDNHNESGRLQGFKVIKFKLNPESEATHQLFIKKHTGEISDLTKEKPPGRTLLCHNVPPYFNDAHLREIFTVFGPVGKIFIHQHPTVSIPEKPDQLFQSEKDWIRGFKVAYVVYKQPKSMNDVLEMNPDEVDPIVLKHKPVCGLKNWIQQYNQKIVRTTELENSVRKFMESFDKQELKRKEMEKNGGEPDEDGWVTVTRTGKRAAGGAIRSEAMEERLRAKKRRQDKQLLNITPAQMKESKMKQLIELKKKFEEDKQRVALLKQQRKFKPF
ncbi:unnamed protein product [Orchesella dallaii]|uniref:Ribosomal RNA-processing protein 7 C-terminal domain-containing protein n=1 Tax=Orchesella dallaii TaxID=48710 RepID=A0ABP1QKZ7_9HEXA